MAIYFAIRGILALMTCFQDDKKVPFDEWWYRRDRTHVVFYQEDTLRILADERGWSCEMPAQDVVIMRKPVN